MTPNENTESVDVRNTNPILMDIRFWMIVVSIITLMLILLQDQHLL